MSSGYDEAMRQADEDTKKSDANRIKWASEPHLWNPSKKLPHTATDEQVAERAAYIGSLDKAHREFIEALKKHLHIKEIP